MTHHVGGLQRWLATEPPKDEGGRLAHLLAGLALGVYSATSTLADTFFGADVDLRRQAIGVVVRMKHARPRALMLAALSDVDPEVRLIAAEVLVQYRRTEAREVLVELLAGKYRDRAAAALLAVGHLFEAEDLDRLSPDDTARAYARVADEKRFVRAYRRTEPGKRAGALAAVVARADGKRSALRRYRRRWERRFGDVGRGEWAMTEALMGAARPQETLGELVDEARSGARRVLLAFASIVDAPTRVDTATAMRIAAALHRWWPTLSSAEGADLLRSLGAIDAAAGLSLARRFLRHIEGAALVAAAEILQRYGTVVDAEALVETLKARSSAPTDGPVLAAAARLCRLEAE
ncbi:MAG: HEAT repeat domain-containing protein [Myxococcota bacterium]